MFQTMTRSILIWSFNPWEVVGLVLVAFMAVLVCMTLNLLPTLPTIVLCPTVAVK